MEPPSRIWQNLEIYSQPTLSETPFSSCSVVKLALIWCQMERQSSSWTTERSLRKASNTPVSLESHDARKLYVVVYTTIVVFYNALSIYFSILRVSLLRVVDDGAFWPEHRLLSLSFTVLTSKHDELVTPAPGASFIEEDGVNNVLLQDICPKGESRFSLSSSPQQGQSSSWCWLWRFYFLFGS